MNIEIELKTLEQESINDINEVIQSLVINPDLEDWIVHANNAYRSGIPIVSDRFYDNVLIEALKIANPSSDFLQEVESEPEGFGKTVQLPERMLSTNKAYSVDTIEKWANNILEYEQEFGEVLFKVTPKLDGFASYYDGTQLYTRGNGLKGSDISRALSRGLIVKNGSIGKGEIVVEKQWFDKHFSTKYENSRNIISSVIKEGALDSDIKEAIQANAVTFIPFSELDCWIGTKEQLLENLELLWDEFVTDSVYDTDGLVIETTNEQIKEKMGFTNHHYRWQIAFKKNTEYHNIKVLSITPQTSKNGRITPVVELEPTKVSGVTISRATGHHYGNIIQKMIDNGAIVKVCRSGLVIPYIEDVIVPAQTVNVPSSCPSCNQPTELDGDNLLCTNKIDCPAQIEGTMEFFFKTIGNCDGFGEKIIQKICDSGITNVVELYTNTEESIYNSGIGGKTATNLINQIKKSTQIKLEDWRFLASFSIPNVGKGGCEKLLKHHSINDIFDLTVNDIIKIDGFAEKTATSLVESLKKIKPNFEVLYPMFNLELTQIGNVNTVSPISGKTVVFTGSMIHGKRTEMETEAKSLGAKVGSSVSSKTDYLIIGENVGATKINAAQKHGVTVLTEQEYLDLIA